MRFSVSSDQLKFFYDNGYLELEEILSKQEAKSLLLAIQSIRRQTPGYELENLYRSIPLIKTLARKNGWGEIASQLIKKHPISIASDHFFFSKPNLTPLEELSCGLLIDLGKRCGFFFKDSFAKMDLYNTEPSCYFLLVLTARRLSNQLNPTVFR